MFRQLAYIIASILENTAHAILDRIDMNPHAEPELYVSRECLEEMGLIAWLSLPHNSQVNAFTDADLLCAMLAQQETKH